MPGTPPLSGQSALVMHAEASALLQVSQKHFRPPPTPVQLGLAGDVDTVLVPVVASSKVIGRLPMLLPAAKPLTLATEAGQ